MVGSMGLKGCIKLTAAVMIISLCCGVSTHERSERALLPRWLTLHDMDEDVLIHSQSGDEQAHITLSDGRLSITSGGEYLSEEGHFTADCFVFDVDADGFDEVMLYVWKRGSYGRFRPFWVEEDPNVYSGHLFIYEWDMSRPDRLDPIWMSSAMPVQGMDISVKEGDIYIISPDNSTTTWRWEGWGLTKAG